MNAISNIGGLPLLALAAAVVIIAAVALLVAVMRRRGGGRLPVFPTPVLTKAEIAFYRRLVRIAARIDGIEIFPQVAMGAVMDAEKSLEKATRMSVRNRFDRKIIDFVVVDRDTRVLLIVELDDSTHDSLRDRDRDAITKAAGYATMRIRGRAAKDDAEIERSLRSHLSGGSS